MRKILRIRDQIDSTVIADMDTVPGDPIVNDAKILSEFKPLSEADILALIRKSSKKTCNVDPMPSKLVVESIDHLLPVIAKMINSSLLGGYFPKAWKETLIYPRYKKAGVYDFTNLLQLVICSICRNWQSVQYLTRYMHTFLNMTSAPCCNLRIDEVTAQKQPYLRYIMIY